MENGEGHDAVFHDDGLLYKNGVNVPLPTAVFGAGLASKTYFDISCVDGYTVPLVLKVQRPKQIQMVVTPPADVSCTLAYDAASPALDPANTNVWQTIADTSFLRRDSGPVGSCPTDEILFPHRRHSVALSLGGGDGYNDASSIGTEQFVMPYDVSGNGLFTSAFAEGATTDLRTYRNPAELAFLAAQSPPIVVPWTNEDIIGCASACSILTKDSGISQQFPHTGLANAHVFPPGSSSYIRVATDVPASDDNGVAEVCCKKSKNPPNPYVVTDTAVQANTSTWWYGNGATAPAPPPAGQGANYAFGFYASVYAPDPGIGAPWYISPAQNGGLPGSKNPYGGPIGGNTYEPSHYTETIRRGVTGQRQTSHAYSYAHDDQYATVICGAVDTANLVPAVDGRPGQRYDHYNVLMEILPDPV